MPPNKLKTAPLPETLTLLLGLLMLKVPLTKFNTPFTVTEATETVEEPFMFKTPFEEIVNPFSSPVKLTFERLTDEVIVIEFPKTILVSPFFMAEIRLASVETVVEA